MKMIIRFVVWYLLAVYSLSLSAYAEKLYDPTKPHMFKELKINSSGDNLEVNELNQIALTAILEVDGIKTAIINGMHHQVGGGLLGIPIVEIGTNFVVVRYEGKNKKLFLYKETVKNISGNHAQGSL